MPPEGREAASKDHEVRIPMEVTLSCRAIFSLRGGMERALACMALAMWAASSAWAQDVSAALAASVQAMGVSQVTSIEYRGVGSSYNFGQAINVQSPWRHLLLKNYVADIDYTVPAMREEMYRTMLDGSYPFGGFEQVQYVSGGDAWNLMNDPLAAVPAPATVGERQLLIRLTPIGFLKAATAQHATLRTQGEEKIVTFTDSDGHKIEGTINAQGLVVKTETWVDNPVLGDMPIITTFSNYAGFEGVQFPRKILQLEGGYPILDLTVTGAKPNSTAAFSVPESVRGVRVPPPTVTSEKIGEGVWFVSAGYQSLVVEFNDYVVVIEASLDEAHAEALIGEAHRLVPNKPIRYVVNTHNHFDHLGGVRTFAAEGVTIIAPAPNVAYYRQVFQRPHSIHPDKLFLSHKQAKIEGVQAKRVLSDGAQTVELYVLPLKGHSDAMIYPYLPKYKLLVEADAYVPLPLTAPPSAKLDTYFVPYTLDLYNRFRQLHIDVGPIAPIHGRMTSWSEMTAKLGKTDP
jgi:glyoxylase-like metal-dependent hydrolase (beta-lactamase superfamily II)